MVIEDVATCLRLTFSWCWLDNSITLYFYHFFIKSFKACWLIPLFLSFTNSPRNLDLQWKPVSWHLQLLILLLPRPSYAFLFPENSNEEVRLWIKLLCIHMFLYQLLISWRQVYNDCSQAYRLRYSDCSTKHSFIQSYNMNIGVTIHSLLSNKTWNCVAPWT